MRVNECESHTTHTDTNTHRHKHTQTDTHAESRGETHRAPNYTVCVCGGVRVNSPQCQSAVTTDMTDRTVKGWEILPGRERERVEGTKEEPRKK